MTLAEKIEQVLDEELADRAGKGVSEEDDAKDIATTTAYAILGWCQKTGLDDDDNFMSDLGLSIMGS